MKHFIIYSVEDDPSINEIYEELLGEIEYVQLTCFADPVQCLKHMQDDKNNNPDLIIVDLTMPIMGGIAFLKELKKTSCKAKTIIVSGHADKESAIQAVNLGAHKVIEKPFDYQYLKSTCLNIAANKKCEEIEEHFQEIYAKFYNFSKKMKNHLDLKVINAENQIYAYENQLKDSIEKKSQKDILSDIANNHQINKEFDELISLIEDHNLRIRLYKKMGK